MDKVDTAVDSAPVSEWVHLLASHTAAERIRAREALVELGAPAATAVAPLAHSSDPQTRWECAKTLAEIAHPVSVDTLIELLEDYDDGIRWDAATGLIAIGPPAVAPLLRAIIGRSKDHAIFPGARHVIHQMCKTEWGGYLQPVYEALKSSHPSASAPVAASKILEETSPAK